MHSSFKGKKASTTSFQQNLRSYGLTANMQSENATSILPPILPAMFSKKLEANLPNNTTTAEHQSSAPCPENPASASNGITALQVIFTTTIDALCVIILYVVLLVITTGCMICNSQKQWQTSNDSENIAHKKTPTTHLSDLKRESALLR